MGYITRIPYIWWALDIVTIIGSAYAVRWLISTIRPQDWMVATIGIALLVVVIGTVLRWQLRSAARRRVAPNPWWTMPALFFQFMTVFLIVVQLERPLQLVFFGIPEPIGGLMTAGLAQLVNFLSP